MKRVFLIGDSIRMGYCETVKEQLKGEAEIYYPAENCRDTQYTYIQLASWAESIPHPERIDLVYWNNGHWDVAHWMKDEDDSLNSPEVYAAMLARVHKRIRSLFPNAKIVFATNTLREEGAEMIHPRSNDELRLYNKTAVEVMQKLQVPVSDICSYAETFGDGAFADGVHFTKENFAKLGVFVAQELRKYLANIPERKMRVLMLGNSFTFYNDMPDMLAKLLDCEVVSHTRGGARLAEQLNPETEMGAKTLKALQEEKWDFVVMQEQSNAPVTTKKAFQESVKKLSALIHENGAVPVLYATWAYREGSEKLAGLEMTYAEMDQGMYDSYHEAAQANDCLVADVGRMFTEMRDIVTVYIEDDYHPTAAASMLAAATIARVIENA